MRRLGPDAPPVQLRDDRPKRFYKLVELEVWGGPDNLRPRPGSRMARQTAAKGSDFLLPSIVPPGVPRGNRAVGNLLARVENEAFAAWAEVSDQQ